MAIVVCYIPPFCFSSPKNQMKYWFLQTIYFMTKCLMKYPIVFFFFSSVSTIKNISAIFKIYHIITHLTGKQFYCGTNFLNTLHTLVNKLIQQKDNLRLFKTAATSVCVWNLLTNTWLPPLIHPGLKSSLSFSDDTCLG